MAADVGECRKSVKDAYGKSAKVAKGRRLIVASLSARA